MVEAFTRMGDIDSDDEDPLIMISLEELGIEFSLLSNLTAKSFMFVFSRIHQFNMRDKLPNLYKIIMGKITKVFD